MTTGNDTIKPRTRLAKFLAKIAGVYGEPIEPKTEIEKYLKEIAEHGSSGGGGGVFFANMVTHPITGESAHLDKTYQEIQDAMSAGKVPYMRLQGQLASSFTDIYSERLVAIILGEDITYDAKKREDNNT